MSALAQALIALALLAACDDRRTTWIPPEDGEFVPVLDGNGEGVAYTARWGRYQRVERWVRVHIDVEFRNLDPRRASTPIEIVPPLDTEPRYACLDGPNLGHLLRSGRGQHARRASPGGHAGRVDPRGRARARRSLPRPGRDPARRRRDFVSHRRLSTLPAR